MKKIFLIAILVCLAFAGCSKDDENQKTITNLTGEVWYDTYVWFRSGEDGGGELSGFQQPGTVGIGGSCTVSTTESYFHVSFDDASGNSRISKTLPFGAGSATVRAADLY